MLDVDAVIKLQFVKNRLNPCPDTFTAFAAELLITKLLNAITLFVSFPVDVERVTEREPLIVTPFELLAFVAPINEMRGEPVETVPAIVSDSV